MTIAKVSTGVLLKIGDGGGPEIFTVVPECTRLSGPGIKFDLLDASSHDNGGSGFREWVPGFADGDVISFTVNWRPSNIIHIFIRTDALNSTRRNFKVIYPDSSPGNTVFVATYIQDWAPVADAGKLLEASGRLKITGAPVWI